MSVSLSLSHFPKYPSQFRTFHPFQSLKLFFLLILYVFFDWNHVCILSLSLLFFFTRFVTQAITCQRSLRERIVRRERERKLLRIGGIQSLCCRCCFFWCIVQLNKHMNRKHLMIITQNLSLYLFLSLI